MGRGCSEDGWQNALKFASSRREEIVTIFDALFGCWHKRISFPQTSKRGQRRCDAATPTGTYVVCLDCGAEFAYDWKEMRILSPRETQPYARAGVEVEACLLYTSPSPRD